MRTTLSTDLTDHPVTSYLNSLPAKQSRAAMKSALRAVLALAMEVDPREVESMAIWEFPWHSLTPDKLNALKARLLSKYSKAHAAKCFAAVRGVMGACFDLELISAEQLMRIERTKGVKVGKNHKAGRRLSDGEILALARVCAEDPTAAGARDDAILGLGYTQGPRISEVVKFRLEDYDPATGDLAIIGGKGGKDRQIRASNSTKESIEEWIELRGSEPGPLFCPVNKGGRVFVGSVSKSSLGKMLAKRAEQAGVKPFTMHDLRRSFLTNGWAMGIPGVQLQTLAGHSSIVTTAGYDRGGLEQALASGERLHYPSLRGRSE